MSWRGWLGLALAVAALGFGWSAWKHRSGDSVGVAQSKQRPDYVMRDFEMISLDEEGRESITLKAPLMERNPADQTYAITTPLFLLPDSTGKAWQLKADTGWLNAKGDQLRLTGDVLGHSPEGAPNPTQFKTTSLNVFPRQNLAQTEAAITITQPGSILTGTGFETNTKTRQYAIKSQSRFHYVPKSAR